MAIRSTGIGWASGVGRSGAILAPIVIGTLVGMALPLQQNFIAIAIPAVIATVAVLMINHSRSASAHHEDVSAEIPEPRRRLRRQHAARRLNVGRDTWRQTRHESAAASSVPALGGAGLAVLAAVPHRPQPSTAWPSDSARISTRRSSATTPAWRRLYKDIHANPELAFEEVNTAKKLAKALRDSASRSPRVSARPAWSGMLRNGAGPTIMVRTELDALPMEEKTGLPYASKVKTSYLGKETFVAHSCGHDIHMASWVGTAGPWSR